LLLLAALAGSAAVPLHAQSPSTYPTRPIRVIVPFPAGVPQDVIIRSIDPGIRARLGQPLVVENKPGAGANIGIELAARAPNDGYTLLTTSSNFLANPSLYSSVRYDPVRDFTPVISLLRTPSVLVVAADSPFRTVADVIAAAKARPGALSYASGGNGSMAHFTGEMFKSAAGIDMLHTPYKSGTETLTSLLSKQTDISLPILVIAMPQIAAGRFRALAVTSPRRMPQLPDVPTMHEVLGRTGFDLETESGIVAPAGTPAEIVARLNAEIGRMMREPSIADPLVASGYEITVGTPAEFGASIVKDVARFADLVKKSGVKID